MKSNLSAHHQKQNNNGWRRYYIRAHILANLRLDSAKGKGNRAARRAAAKLQPWDLDDLCELGIPSPTNDLIVHGAKLRFYLR